MAFFISSSPHNVAPKPTHQLMMLLLLCALPGLIAQVVFFGWGTLIQLGLAISVALVAEMRILLCRKRNPLPALKDGSAIVTAWLLAVAIPAYAPWWIIVIGTLFAIVLAKHLYGGLGHNLFNPAMVGYVVLLISFPVQMTSWPDPLHFTLAYVPITDAIHLIFTGYDHNGFSLLQLRESFDGVSMATPLDAMKTGFSQDLIRQDILANEPFVKGNTTSWIWINFMYLIGGLIMLRLRIIIWYIPVAMLTSLGLLSLGASLFFASTSMPLWTQLFSGATMLGAFFIATDPVSASTTVKGRLIYGALIGVVVFVIRQWGGYPDGVAFAVLIANMCVPLIDDVTRPRTYGH